MPLSEYAQNPGLAENFVYFNDDMFLIKKGQTGTVF